MDCPDVHHKFRIFSIIWGTPLMPLHIFYTYQADVIASRSLAKQSPVKRRKALSFGIFPSKWGLLRREKHPPRNDMTLSVKSVRWSVWLPDGAGSRMVPENHYAQTFTGNSLLARNSKSKGNALPQFPANYHALPGRQGASQLGSGSH